MADDDGFLSRWSRRKVQARTGEPLPPEAPAPQKPLAAAPNVAAPQLPDAQTQAVERDADTAAQPTQQPPTKAAQPPLPTMQDVMALTKESDYSAFVQPSVDPTVRNAAMKKLFSDPFFNEMDGLDIYIDDYSQPNPLPMSLARKLTSAKVLNLFETPEEKAARLAAEAAKHQPDAAALDSLSHPDAEHESDNTSHPKPQATEANPTDAAVQPETQPQPGSESAPEQPMTPPTTAPHEPSVTGSRPTTP